MATLPQQVRDQIAEADRIAKEIFTPEEPDDKPEAAANEAEAAEQPETPVVEKVVAEKPAEVVEEKPEPVAEEKPEAPPVVEEEDPNSETYKQRWKTQQGMMQAEARKNRELMDRVNTLETMLSRLQELHASAPPAQEPAPQPEKPQSALTAEDVEDYGSDLIEVMKKAAQDAVKADLESLRKENTELKQLLGGVGQKVEMSEKDQFFAQLGTKVDNWEHLNKDPQFNAWLDEVDVYAGSPRRGMLMNAFQANDVERVARFFQGFMNETAAVAEVASGQQPTPQAQPTPAPTQGSGKVPLDSLAAPGVGSSGSADNTSQSSGRMWKESEIAAFYEDSRKGAYKGREAEYKKAERQIQAALTKGNILLGQ